MKVKDLKRIIADLDDDVVIKAAVSSEGQYGFEIVWNDFDASCSARPVVLYIDDEPEEE